MKNREYIKLPKELKECSQCHSALPLSEFRKAERYKNSLNSRCKKCDSEYSEKWKKNNPEKVKKIRSRNHQRHKEKHHLVNSIWHEKNPKRASEKSRRHYFKKLYGITSKDYDRMLECQNGLCAICGKPEERLYKGTVMRLDVDHDHKTGKVRGLLCHKCNCVLGWGRDDIEILEKAIEYLSKNNFHI